MTRRVIRGVLGNFIGTYTSRYSDYDGYWLFGFLVGDLGALQIDLLASPVGESDSPLDVAVRSAVAKFQEQLQKAGVARSQLCEAWLTIRKLSGPADGLIGGHRCSGYHISFSAGALMDSGRRYEREQVLFVAPHNAAVELRSGRVV